MSRGFGRRGGGAGRSKAGNARTARIGGVEIAYDDGLDEHLKSRVQPAPLFPEYEPYRPTALNAVELDQVDRLLEIRRQFQSGPLYANMGNSSDTPQFNPFEDMDAYSQRYLQRARTLPQFSHKQQAPRNFPKELWSVVGTPRNGPRSGPNGVSRQKKIATPRIPATNGTKLEQMDEDEDAEDAEDEVPEELDDEYDSDEEEMAGDYNAEQYFDNGGEDIGDDYDLEGGEAGDAFN